MANPLRKYARFVQRELQQRMGVDLSYQWCLTQVQKNWFYAEGQRASERKRIILERVEAVAKGRHTYGVA